MVMCSPTSRATTSPTLFGGAAATSTSCVNSSGVNSLMGPPGSSSTMLSLTRLFQHGFGLSRRQGPPHLREQPVLTRPLRCCGGGGEHVGNHSVFRSGTLRLAADDLPSSMARQPAGVHGGSVAAARLRDEVPHDVLRRRRPRVGAAGRSDSGSGGHPYCSGTHEFSLSTPPRLQGDRRPS